MATPMFRTIASAAALISVAAVSPATAAMQGEDTKLVQAAQLEKQAAELESSSTTKVWYRAATLYVRAAELRPAGDPRAVESLKAAGRLFFYVDKPEEARQALQQAGDRALQAGDLMNAGQSYALVAWVAGKAGWARTMRQYSRKAELVAHSPLLTNEQRFEIVRFLDPATVATTPQAR